MFERWKEKREQAKARNMAILESRYWREHALLRHCIEVMRGNCTVAPMELHEATIAVVNIALSENIWTQAERIPEEFLADMLYIVWNDEKIPVLKAPRDLVLENFSIVTAVAEKTFLVSDTMDRIVHWSEGSYYLYTVA